MTRRLAPNPARLGSEENLLLPVIACSARNLNRDPSALECQNTQGRWVRDGATLSAAHRRYKSGWWVSPTQAGRPMAGGSRSSHARVDELQAVAGLRRRDGTGRLGRRQAERNPCELRRLRAAEALTAHERRKQTAPGRASAGWTDRLRVGEPVVAAGPGEGDPNVAHRQYPAVVVVVVAERDAAHILDREVHADSRPCAGSTNVSHRVEPVAPPSSVDPVILSAGEDGAVPSDVGGYRQHVDPARLVAGFVFGVG